MQQVAAHCIRQSCNGAIVRACAILEDFKEFEKRGLEHRQMAQIKALLAGK